MTQAKTKKDKGIYLVTHPGATVGPTRLNFRIFYIDIAPSVCYRDALIAAIQ